MKKLVLVFAIAAFLVAPGIARAERECNELKAKFDEHHERVQRCVVDRAATTDDEPFSIVLVSAGIAVAVGAGVAFVLLRRGAEAPELEEWPPEEEWPEPAG